MKSDSTASNDSRNPHPFMVELREDHARFSRVLMLISRDAHLLETDPQSVLPLFEEAIDYIVNFQNVHHHPREELMFSRIAASSAALKKKAEQLHREHKSLGRAGKRMLNQLRELQDGDSPGSSRAALARGMIRFSNNMRAHIRSEEEIMYSQASSRLTERDWRAIAKEPSPRDPLQNLPDDGYPLLSRYVIEGSGQIRVHPRNVGCYERGLARVRNGAAIAGRHLDELFDVSSRTMRELPPIPVLKPRKSWGVIRQSASDLGKAGQRWQNDWRNWLGESRREFR